jgi:polysaccharide deacetylase 2 family uncharacterized protein YibQ
MTTKKTKPAKAVRKAKKPGKKRSNKGLSITSVLAIVAVAAIFLVLVVQATRHYHAVLVLDEVEKVVGTLEPEGVVLQVSKKAEGEAVVQALQKVAGRGFGTFRVDGVRESYGGINATLLFKDETFALRVHWLDEDLPAAEPYTGDGPVMAIVIDDMGTNIEIARAFMELELPITPAILPHLRYSTAISQLASRLNRRHLLHMPMEPIRYPVNDPGEGALMAATSPVEVPDLIAAALAEVPGAEGINNHMGSRATQAGPLMDSVMVELRARGLSFLDSRTSPESVAATSAKRAGVPWLKRDIFIDNIRTDEALDERMKASVALAKGRGVAVLIGHHYPVTLEALKRWQPLLAKEGITVVPLFELFNH